MIEPTNTDVLLGRGVATNRHPGNETFRAIVSEHVSVYVSSTKKQKMMISRSVVEHVRTKLSPPGRFLEKDPSSGTWQEVGDRRALEKTAQALRDGAAPLRKQLLEEVSVALKKKAQPMRDGSAPLHERSSEDISDLRFSNTVSDGTGERSGKSSASTSSPYEPPPELTWNKHRRTKTAPSTELLASSSDATLSHPKKQRSNPEISQLSPADMQRFLTQQENSPFPTANMNQNASQYNTQQNELLLAHAAQLNFNKQNLFNQQNLSIQSGGTQAIPMLQRFFPQGQNNSVQIEGTQSMHQNQPDPNLTMQTLLTLTNPPQDNTVMYQPPSGMGATSVSLVQRDGTFSMQQNQPFPQALQNFLSSSGPPQGIAGMQMHHQSSSDISVRRVSGPAGMQMRHQSSSDISLRGVSGTQRPPQTLANNTVSFVPNELAAQQAYYRGQQLSQAQGLNISNEPIAEPSGSTSGANIPGPLSNLTSDTSDGMWGRIGSQAVTTSDYPLSGAANNAVDALGQGMAQANDADFSREMGLDEDFLGLGDSRPIDKSFEGDFGKKS